MRRIFASLSCAVLLTAVVLVNAQVSAPTSTPSGCTALTSLQVPGVALTVSKAEWIAAGSTAGRGGGAPLSAYFKGQGDPQDARNFGCR